ncbi:basic proline-rich protein [Setaria italica]|uniref:basic proline-rich protein n=1 Tax=Setaria italica TaxID=4555 RepID=UPI0003512D02|nr:basic proline-rich protein [Setaria italica]
MPAAALPPESFKIDATRALTAEPRSSSPHARSSPLPAAASRAVTRARRIRGRCRARCCPGGPTARPLPVLGLDVDGASAPRLPHAAAAAALPSTPVPPPPPPPPFPAAHPRRRRHRLLHTAAPPLQLHSAARPRLLRPPPRRRAPCKNWGVAASRTWPPPPHAPRRGTATCGFRGGLELGLRVLSPAPGGAGRAGPAPPQLRLAATSYDALAGTASPSLSGSRHAAPLLFAAPPGSATPLPFAATPPPFAAALVDVDLWPLLCRPRSCQARPYGVVERTENGNINSLIHCIELSCWCVLILFQKGLLFYKKFFYKRTTLEQLHCWSCTHVLLKNRPRSSSPNLQISRSDLDGIKKDHID